MCRNWVTLGLASSTRMSDLLPALCMEDWERWLLWTFPDSRMTD
jgi:hypothetical protein